MRKIRSNIEREIKSAQHQLPVTLSRTGLNIFPRSNADMPPEQLVAVICRNLLFYQIQHMCCKDADEQTDVSSAFSAYSKSMRDFLHNSKCLELYLCHKTSSVSNAEAAKIRKSLNQLPTVPENSPKEIQIIQNFIHRTKNLFSMPSEKFYPEMYKIQSDWIGTLCGKDMQLISAGQSLHLADTEIRRRNSRHENSQRNKEKWGEEFHTYYTKHLSAGYCEQTAKRLARQDFINAHPLNQNGDDTDFTNFPGHHRCSLLQYHKTYLEKRKRQKQEFDI